MVPWIFTLARLTSLRALATRIAAAVVVSVGLLPSFVFATENCDCDHYRDLIPYSSLADQAAELSLRSLNAGSFEPSRAWEQSYQLKLDADNLIPERCKEKLRKSLPRVRFVARRAFDLGNPGAKTTEFSGIDLLSHHTSLLIASTPCTRPDGYSAAYGFTQNAPGPTVPSPEQRKQLEDYAACLEREVNNSVQRLSEAFRKGEVKVIGATPGRLAMLGAYNEILNIPRDPSARERAKGYYNKMSTQEKLALRSLLGGIFADNYDTKRRESGTSNSHGAVSLEEILGAAKSSSESVLQMQWLGAKTFLDHLANPDMPPRPIALPRAKAGVCRDIATALAKLSRDMGFRNNYVVTFSTGGIDQGKPTFDMHTTSVSEDPDPRLGTTYVQDYSKIRASTYHDSRDLYQGDDDVSLSYMIHTPEGNFRVNLPSEQGKVVGEIFDRNDAMNPLLKRNGELYGVDATLSRKLETQARGGYAVDGLGATYAFAAVRQPYAIRSWLPGNVGVALVHQERAISDPTQSDLNQLDALYVHLRQQFATPELKLNDELQARIEALADGVLMVARGKSEAPGIPSGVVPVSGDLFANVGVRVDQGNRDSRFSSTYRAGVQAVPGLSDVQNMDKPTLPMLNHLLFTAEGRAQLGQTMLGRAYLAAATSVLYDQLGTKGRAELGVVADRAALLAKTEGRLKKSSPLFQDGAERVVGGRFVFKLNDHAALELSGERSLERFLGQKPNTRLSGGLGGSF